MIEPGIGTTKYRLGCNVEEIDLIKSEAFEIEDREILVVYKFSSIWFFINPKTNKLDQVSVFTPIGEKVLDKVGIGDSLECIQSNFGDCVINDRVYEPKNYDGISFELAKGGKSIYCISVFLPHQFYGELPEHIAKSMQKGKKLP